jgi:hypothetical protein
MPIEMSTIRTVSQNRPEGVQMKKVHSPLGGETLKYRAVAPRLGRLDGMTIGELWNGDFKGDYTFPIIRGLLQKNNPGVRIIPFTAFPYIHGADNPVAQKALAKAIAAHAKELGCDAVISGNGA